MDETFDWSSRYVGCRLMGVLCQLEKALSTGKLPHYYMPDVNLLGGLTSKNTGELRTAVHRLLNSKAEMMSVLRQCVTVGQLVYLMFRVS